VGAVTSQRVLKVLFYVNILQCFFVVEVAEDTAVVIFNGVTTVGNAMNGDDLRHNWIQKDN
jgi:hypothetical protein